MEISANQPPRPKLAAPSGTAAAVGSPGDENGIAQPDGRAHGPGPALRASAGFPATEPALGTCRKDCSRALGCPRLDEKSCGPVPSALRARRPRPVLCRACRDLPPSLPPEESQPVFSLGLLVLRGRSLLTASHCCWWVLTVVWDGRRFLAKGMSGHSPCGGATGPLRKGTVCRGRVV